MSEFYVKSDGDDKAAGNSKGTAWATLKAATGRVDPHGSDRLIVLSGEYAGAHFYGEPTNWKQGVGSLEIEFAPGARITSPNDAGSGLKVEGWGGLVKIIGADVAPMPRECIFIATVQRAELIDGKATGSNYINVQLSEVLEGLVQNLDSRYCTDQHGLYLANGTEFVVVKGGRMVGNNKCGIQQNVDNRQRHPAMPAHSGRTNQIVGVFFFMNGRAGGGDINDDGGDGMRILSNYFAGRAGGGSMITHFHSDYNKDTPARNTLAAGNTFRGGGCYGVFNFGQADHSIRIVDNDIDVTPLNGQKLRPKVIEFDGGRPAPGSGFVFEANRYNGEFTDAGNPLTPNQLNAIGIGVSLPGVVGIALPELTEDYGGNPRPTPPTVGAFEEGTDIPTDVYDPPPAPPVPPPTPTPWLVVPEFPPPEEIGTPTPLADVSKYDTTSGARGALCREWDSQDPFSGPPKFASLQPPPNAFWDGGANPTPKGRFGPPNVAMDFRFLYVPSFTGPACFHFEGEGALFGQWCGKTVLSGSADNGPGGPRYTNLFQRVEEGKGYPVWLGFTGTRGDVVPSLRMYIALPGADKFQPVDRLECYPALNANPVPPVPPVPPSPPVPPQPPVPPPPPAGGIMRERNPDWDSILELLRAAAGK